MTTNNLLLDHTCDIIECYQKFMVYIRYKDNKNDDLIWNRNKKMSAYGFVPTKHIKELVKILTTTLSYLRKKYNTDSFSFLDAGCGVGNILLMAQIVGFSKVHGIELDPRTVKIARRLLGSMHSSNFRIINSDLSKYNKYKNYDVIYYYQPIQPSSKQLMKFLSLMRDNMKIGAIVITNGTNPFCDDRRFKKIKSVPWWRSDGVYEKMREPVGGRR